MATHQKALLQKSEDTVRQHGLRDRQGQDSDRQISIQGYQQNTLRETSFHPSINEHIDRLSSISSPMQRQNFIIQLQRTYGNQYVQRILAKDKSDGISASQETSDQKVQLENKNENKAAAPTPDLKAEVEKAVAVLPDPKPVPEEEQLKEAKNLGEKKGKEIQAEESSNKALAALLMMDDEERAAKEPPPPKSMWERFKSWVKGPGKSVEEMEDYDKWGQRGSKAKTALEWASKGAKLFTYVPGIVNHFFTFLSLISDWDARKKADLQYTELSEALKAAKQSAKNQFGKDDPQMEEVINSVEFAMNQKYKAWWKRLVSFLSTLITTGVSAAVWAGGYTLSIAGISAMLVSNPIGWGIILGLGAIGTIAGLALAGYKLYRWWSKGEDRGKDRKKTAERLFSALVVGKDKAAALARDAIATLGLLPELMVKAWREAIGSGGRKRAFDSAVQQIMQRLKST